MSISGIHTAFENEFEMGFLLTPAIASYLYYTTMEKSFLILSGMSMLIPAIIFNAEYVFDDDELESMRRSHNSALLAGSLILFTILHFSILLVSLYYIYILFPSSDLILSILFFSGSFTVIYMSIQMIFMYLEYKAQARSVK